jgi:hypothetical protein
MQICDIFPHIHVFHIPIAFHKCPHKLLLLTYRARLLASFRKDKFAGSWKKNTTLQKRAVNDQLKIPSVILAKNEDRGDNPWRDIRLHMCDVRISILYRIPEEKRRLIRVCGPFIIHLKIPTLSHWNLMASHGLFSDFVPHRHFWMLVLWQGGQSPE